MDTRGFDMGRMGRMGRMGSRLGGLIVIWMIVAGKSGEIKATLY